MKTILMVVNDSTVRQQLQQILIAESYEIQVMPTGEAGLAWARSHHPDLVICAAELPDIDCLMFLARLRHAVETAAIAVIAIAPTPPLAEVANYYRHVMNLGANDVLFEPLDAHDVLASVYARFYQQDALHQQYVTALRHAAERLNQLERYDGLTELPNHLLFQERFDAAVQQRVRSDQPIALLLIHLNRLSRINNMLGYPCGDALIQAVAAGLRDCLSPGDTLARLTGSQFAVLLTEVDDRRDIQAMTEMILAVLAQPIPTEVQDIFLTVSIGVAVYPVDGATFAVLIQRADAAMAQARGKKGNHYEIYQPGMDVVPDSVLDLESQLQHALQRQEFQLVYQPQVNLGTGEVEGVEALIRWAHPQQGWVSPLKFIPLAEESGLIVPIGNWVLQQACWQVKQWQNRGLDRPLRMSVNVSGYQFGEPTLAETVRQILAETELSPECLELELTETSLVQDLTLTVQLLNEFKQQGIRLAIDDFGTGYSSLNYIKLLPVDALKLDHSFVRNSAIDPTNRAIITAMIQLAHQLDLRVVAEGVETAEELHFLRQHHCDIVQGYFTSPPLAAREVEDFLARYRSS